MTQILKFGSISKYSLLEADQSLAFPAGVRNTLDFIASEPCMVVIKSENDVEPLACPVEGGFGTISFSSDTPAKVTFVRADPDEDGLLGAVVHVALRAKDFRVERVELPSYTNIAPRPAVDPQFQALWQMMHEKTVQLEAAAAQETAALRKELATVKAKAAAVPVVPSVDPVVDEDSEEEVSTDE